jgi:pimeloyl-ACP methyl ester carboxylesterase
MSCVVRLHGERDWHEDYRRTRLARIPEPQRQRYTELRRRRDVEGDVDPALAAELRQLGIATEFADARVAERFEAELHAALASVNDVVNRELGADFARHFASPRIRERLRNLDVPVLVVHGDADPDRSQPSRRWRVSSRAPSWLCCRGWATSRTWRHPRRWVGCCVGSWRRCHRPGHRGATTLPTAPAGHSSAPR